LTDRLLGIYLSDHFAGSAIARSRCSYAAAKNRGNDFGTFLERLGSDIDLDRQTLRGVIERVGTSPSRLKVGAGVVFERMSRLKPDGRLTGYSPLTRLLEFEAFSIGVEGKRLMWVVLGDLRNPRLSEFDFGALAERAIEQRKGIEQQRRAGLSRARDGRVPRGNPPTPGAGAPECRLITVGEGFTLHLCDRCR
jgi:hypothetical protein